MASLRPLLVLPQLAKVLDDVIGEGIVIIDDEEAS